MCLLLSAHLQSVTVTLVCRASNTQDASRSLSAPPLPPLGPSLALLLSPAPDLHADSRQAHTQEEPGAVYAGCAVCRRPRWERRERHLEEGIPRLPAARQTKCTCPGAPTGDLRHGRNWGRPGLQPDAQARTLLVPAARDGRKRRQAAAPGWRPWARAKSRAVNSVRVAPRSALRTAAGTRGQLLRARDTSVTCSDQRHPHAFISTRAHRLPDCQAPRTDSGTQQNGAGPARVLSSGRE